MPSPSPSPSPTPPVNCSPRPPVTVRSAPAANGALQVSLAAGTATSGTNRLLEVRFQAGANAVVDVGTHAQAGPFTITIPGGAATYSFQVKRSSNGAVTVPLVVVDSCGEWKTFVGGGANAF
jgi:hypothetical protein